MWQFEVYQDMRNIKDSMQLDSGTDICKLTTDAGVVEICVQGFVCVDWSPSGFKDDDIERYKHPSEFPDELKLLIETDPNWTSDKRLYINENNWFEIFLNEDEAYDVVDIEGYTEEELLSLCLEMLDTE